MNDHVPCFSKAGFLLTHCQAQAWTTIYSVQSALTLTSFCAFQPARWTGGEATSYCPGGNSFRARKCLSDELRPWQSQERAESHSPGAIVDLPCTPHLLTWG